MRPRHSSGCPRPGAECASRRASGSLKFSAKSVGWGTWIRTKINGVKVRCSTVELSPKALGFAPLESWDGTAAPSAPNVASRGARYHLGHRRRAAKTVCAVGRSSSRLPFARRLRLCRARLPSVQSRWSRRARPGGTGCRAVHEPTDLRARWRALPSRLRCGRRGVRGGRRRCGDALRANPAASPSAAPVRPTGRRLPPTRHRPACRRLRLRHPLRHRPQSPAATELDGPAPRTTAGTGGSTQSGMAGCAVWTDRCVICQRDSGIVACSNIGIACQPQPLMCLRSEVAPDKKPENWTRAPLEAARSAGRMG